MARPNPTVQQRAASLTEELERLEQSITLTLQEIDHNFSKAHRIVTSSIIPIVEQYATHSREVWEGSKFWKQFFESSANVSLSGYEEQPSTHESIEETVTEESNATTHTTLEESNSYDTPSAQHISTSSIQDLDLSNLTISPSHSTPRPSKNPHQQPQPKFSEYISPYEALRQEVQNTTNLEDANLNDQSRMEPSTPNPRSIIRDVAMTPTSSPALPRISPNALPQPSTSRRKNADPLLHRVLDKTYRIQATPMTANRLPSQREPTIRTPSTKTRQLFNDLSSSPELAPPQLHAEVFASPDRKTAKPPPRRTPGISVLTPARGTKFENAMPASATRTADGGGGGWDSDDDDDSEMSFGASPPKTMQFHVPQSRLLKTPAHEASKRIVEGILETAGMSRYGQDEDGTDNINDFDDIDIDIDVDLDDEGEYEMDPNSPSVVRKAVGLEDETF